MTYNAPVKDTGFLTNEMLGACNLAFKLHFELSHGTYHLMLNIPKFQ